MNIEELLAYSLDNELTAAQQGRLEQALADSKDLQELQDELLAMRSLLQGHVPASNKNFIQNVLQQVPLNDTVVPISTTTRILQLFPRVAAACIVLMSMTYVGLELGDTNWISDTVVGTQYLSAEDAYAYIDTYE